MPASSCWRQDLNSALGNQGSTDCFNNADGLIVLQAGEEWAGAFGVKLAQ